jgi:hypothetical protein
MLVKCVILKPLSYYIVRIDAATAVGRFSTAVNIEVWSIFNEY